MLSNERLDASGEVVAGTSEDGRELVVGALGGRIFNAPVDVASAAGKDWTILPGVVADGHHVVEFLFGKFIYGLGAMVGNIDASRMTSIASGRTCVGSVPALWISKRSPAAWRRSPSAIWLRAEFPVQMMRIRLAEAPLVIGGYSL